MSDNITGGIAVNSRQPVNKALDLFHQAQIPVNTVKSQFHVFLLRSVRTINSEYFPMQH
jgi:hypothetical protein